MNTNPNNLPPSFVQYENLTIRHHIVEMRCLLSVFSDSCLLRSDVPGKGRDSDYSFHPEFLVKGSRGRTAGSLALPVLASQSPRVVSGAFDVVKSRKAELYSTKQMQQEDLDQRSSRVHLAVASNVDSETRQMKRELVSILCQPPSPVSPTSGDNVSVCCLPSPRAWLCLSL